MTYEQFQTDVVDTLEKWLPGNTSFTIRQIVKPNDRILDGLIISDPQTEVAPTIYLNPYFDALSAGGASFDEIIENIFRLYKDNRTSASFDQDEFMSWDRAKSHITYRILNRRTNEKFLEDVPFISYMDLAIIFTYLLTVEEAGQGSIVIHKCHASNWGVEAKDLFAEATTNTPSLLPAVCKPMSDMLDDLLPGHGEELPDDIPDMLVLSNSTKTYGAAAILYTGLLKSIAKKLDSDFYVLPSSVHEVLLLPAGDKDIKSDLSAMVREVNASQVPDGEVLSDHAYYFCAADSSLY
ncbi:MAG: DUF5688 family protein [Lachnospiraceae bacterium]|nr:DUF5688 family protein [Lachnospiraceae bacterium]